MAVYDGKIHQDVADILLARASRIVPVFTAMAAIVGAGVGVTIARGIGRNEVISVILWTVIFGLFGFVTGKERSFSLQLKARELLCMMAIERNTSGTREPKVAGASV